MSAISRPTSRSQKPFLLLVISIGAAGQPIFRPYHLYIYLVRIKGPEDDAASSLAVNKNI